MDVSNKISIFKGQMDDYWHWIIGGAVIFIVLFMWYYRVDKFISAQIDSKLPYTSGANIRILSEDSATNRGTNDTWSI